jgi:hypothetical protein
LRGNNSAELLNWIELRVLLLGELKRLRGGNDGIVAE